MKSITSDSDLYTLADKAGVKLNNVVSRDELTKMPYDNYIINLAPSTSAGTHWVALYLPSGSGRQAVYFDSFGMIPPLEVIKLIRNSGHSAYLCNDKQIQDVRSGFCGEYCLAFLKYMNTPGSSQQNLKQFLSKFRKLN